TSQPPNLTQPSIPLSNLNSFTHHCTMPPQPYPAITSHVLDQQILRASLTSPSHAYHPDSTPALQPDSRPPVTLESLVGTADTAGHYKTTRSAATDQVDPWSLRSGRWVEGSPQGWSAPPGNHARD